MNDKVTIDYRYILIGIIVLLIAGYIWLWFKYDNVRDQYNDLSNQIENPTTKIDTVVLYDTITLIKPVESRRTPLKERIDTVFTTVVESGSDSLKIDIPVSLPLVEKEYSDSNYRAVIKGVEFGQYPSLESMQIFQSTNYITTEKTIVKKPKWAWNATLGVGASYDIINRQFVPTIGITVGYGIIIK